MGPSSNQCGGKDLLHALLGGQGASSCQERSLSLPGRGVAGSLVIPLSHPVASQDPMNIPTMPKAHSACECCVMRCDDGQGMDKACTRGLLSGLEVQREAQARWCEYGLRVPAGTRAPNLLAPSYIAIRRELLRQADGGWEEESSACIPWAGGLPVHD